MIFVIIPREVYADKDISGAAKIAYGLIVSLAYRDGYCYAENKFLADALNKSIRSVNNYLTELKEKDLIRIETHENRFRRIFTRTAAQTINPTEKARKTNVRRVKWNREPDWMDDYLHDLAKMEG